MRKLGLLGIALVMALGLLVPMMAQATAVYAHEPPPGNEGLTPGFWKNHLDMWPVAPDAYYFDDVFGVGPHVTLLDALSLSGSIDDALARHAVAAVLNAAHPDISYPASVGAIISAVGTYWGTADAEWLKDILDSFNNLGGNFD